MEYIIRHDEFVYQFQSTNRLDIEASEEKKVEDILEDNGDG